MVVRGEAGVGKSALPDYAAEHAADFTLLRGVGVEGESGLAYAALHLILHLVLDGVDRLPGPQASAIRGAFALSDAAVDERFGVSQGASGCSPRRPRRARSSASLTTRNGWTRHPRTRCCSRRVASSASGW